MKNIIFLVFLEFKYLFRQKFLWLLVLIGSVIIVYRMPRFDYEMNYQVFEEFNRTYSYENMSEAEKLIVDYWNTKKVEIEAQREELVKQAIEKKTLLSEDKRFEKEYLTKIETAYDEIIELEVQDYLGWEIFFVHQASMSPHSPICFLEIVIIASAGLLLLTKDRENNTLFWASLTGRGTRFSVYALKLFTVLLYANFVQIIFNGIYIVGLWLVVELDMRHWLNLIQNIPQFGMCDITLNIFTTIILDMMLKSILAFIIMMSVFMFARVLKRYLFMFMSTLAVSGILYYWLFVMCEMKNYGMGYRLNPFSIFQLDRILTYDAVCVMNHAVDIRLITVGLCLGILLLLIFGCYQVWRKYLYVSS